MPLATFNAFFTPNEVFFFFCWTYQMFRGFSSSVFHGSKDDKSRSEQAPSLD